MSCKGCEELNVEYRINSPSDLRQAIAVASDCIVSGIIQEVPAQATAVRADTSFQEVASGDAWDDFVCFAFQGSHCGQLFQLSAETYHGSGGTWRPVVAQAL